MMRSAQLVTLLDSSTADAITVSIIKPVLRVSGDPSVVIDHRYVLSLKVSQLKDILQALRDAHGPCIQFSTTGNKDVLVQRVLVALYPQHASVILSDRGANAPASNPQSDFRPSSTLSQAAAIPGQMPPAQQYPVSSFAAIPPMNGAYGITGPPGSFHAASLQPSNSPRVQVHLRASGTAAPSPQFPARVPIIPQPSVVSPLLKEAVSRWSHPMFQPLAFETFAFTHPVTNFQAALPFDKPQPPSSLEKIIIVPFTRRGNAASSSFVPFQLQPGVSVAVSWNNCPVEIPKFVNVKSKLAAATIHPHPMFVPPGAPFFKVGPNRLVMTGGGAENVFGVAVMLVRPRRLEDLEALVRSHPMSKILNRPEFNQDDDCAATSTPVHLKDPLSFCRIQIPVKTVKCKHVQCFDLATFIQYCERNGICKPGLSIYDVYVDQFFLDMIKDASAHDTNTVYLKPDGSWTTTDPDTAPAPPSLPVPPPALPVPPPALPTFPPSQPLVQRIRVFPDGVQSVQGSWLFELPVGSTVKTLKAAIEARCQLPRELFVLNWHERKVSCPEALSCQGQSLEDSSTPSPTILIEMKEILTQDEDQVRVFGPGHASQEVALQNEAFYSMNWLIDRKHARAFLSFRLSPTKADELYSILNMLVDELNSSVDSEWQKNPQLSLTDFELKLLAAFAPSSQQDMQKCPEFWASYHQIFLKSILDYHQLGRNRHSVSGQAASQTPTQPRNASPFANGLVARAAAEMHAAVIPHRGDMNTLQSSSDAASAAISNPVLQLSRVIGQQDAADRLRAAAEWLDARSDTPCSDDLPAVIAALSGGRDSIGEDDMPLVLPPQHLMAPGRPSNFVDMRPAVTRAVQEPIPRQVGGGGVPAVSRVVENRPEHQLRTASDARRQVSQPSIGLKRPAPNSLGSSASNAIVIDDD